MNTPSSADGPTLPPILVEVLEGARLSESRAYEAFSIIMNGGANDAQIAALLALIQSRGPTAAELTGAARVMREYVEPVPVDESLRADLIDTCGTGGAPKTFNISTAAAIVAAGAGAKVAKHGNRSRTGRGSAEVLAQLGVNIDASPVVQAKCLEEAGVCFSFAIHHHPAIHHAMPARRALGFPTIFNLLGPMTNPAGAKRQLIGVYAPQFTELLARTLTNLDCERAMVVHGMDGLDEITTTTPTKISEVRNGTVNCTTIDPVALGLDRASLDDLRETDLEGAAKRIRRVLAGDAGPARDIVLLNAAAALVIADLAEDFASGLEGARKSIDTGAARGALEQLATVSQG